MNLFPFPKSVARTRGSPHVSVRLPIFAAWAVSLLALAAFALLSSPAFAVTDTLSAALQLVADTPGENVNEVVFGLFIGVVLTAAAYLFFIWIVMRDRGQVSLILLLLCLGIYIANTNSVLMQQMGLYNLASGGLIANYSLIFACFFSVLFTYYFLEISLNSSILFTAMIVTGALLLFLLAYSVYDETLAHFALPAVCTLTIGVVVTAGGVSCMRGMSGSISHIIAFLFLLVGILADPFYDLGLIVHADSANDIIYGSFSMAALMFAIVIATQFAARQDEKEKALAISNERFSLATRGANEGLFEWNLATGEVFFSEQFRKILGVRLENKPRSLKVWIRLIVPPDRRVVREALRRFRYNLEVNIINVEYRISLHENDLRWLHSKAVAVRDPYTKRVVRLVGSTSDITARKQNEGALRASEMRFRSITEAHPVPLMIVSLLSYQVVYASPSAEELLGVPQNKLLHRALSEFLADDQSFREIIQAMGQGHEVNLMEVALRRGGGNALVAALSARRITYQEEDCTVIGLYDLTERKQAEMQIAQQQEALQQTEKMAALGGLLAGVAHELNNPLSVIVGQSTLLMESSPGDKVFSRAEKIFKAADRCSRIVKSFLALARRKPPERKLIDLNGIINATLDLLGFQIRTESIQITLNLDPNLPEVTGDGDQLTQVVTNMIINSLQAMQGWSGTRQLTITSSTQGPEHVTVSVADTGPGVPADIRNRIFEPFFTTKGGSGGTGVGLSLCLNIVVSHGGSFTLEDTPGGGATFIATLPAGVVSAETGAPLLSSSTSVPQNLRLLLVDDEIELAQTLADLLEPEGYQIDIAINGAVAMEKLHKGTYDAIISDLRMPVMDGPALYAALKNEMPAYLDRILYVTGDTLSAHVQEFLRQYPVPFIEKPYRLKDVNDALAKMLKDKEANGAPPGVSALIPPTLQTVR